MRGGFHSGKKRASAFIQQQLQQEAAVLNSDERSDKVSAAPRPARTIAWRPFFARRGSEIVVGPAGVIRRRFLFAAVA